MNSRFASAAMIAISTALVFGEAAHGRKPRTDTDLLLRFENLAEFPQFDFYLKYALPSTQDGATPHLTRVGSDAFVSLTAPNENIGEVFLLAVPRGQKIEVPAVKPLDKDWLRSVPPGGLQSAPLPARPDATLLPGFPHVGVEITYRVSLDGPALKVDCVGWRSLFPVWWHEPCAGFGFIAVLVAALVAALYAAYRHNQRRQKAD